MVVLSRTSKIAMAGLSLVMGCGAPPSDDGSFDEEIVEQEELAATTALAVAARYLRGSSTAKKFRGSGADYIACTGYPIAVAYDYQNTGSVVLRDVDGKGSTKGSDVKLVTTSGKKDPVSRRKYRSVGENGNAWVRSDRKAANCYEADGCRNTRFRMFRAAPTKPGFYTSRWRLRDYSAAWDATSKPFGPVAKLRFNIKDCSSVVECGCTAHCTNTQSLEVPANWENCTSVAEAMCGGKDKLLKSVYVPCPDDPPGAGGSSGSGAGGSSGSGAGGSGGGSGGTSSGGTSSGGSSGSGGGCSSCELPLDLQEDGESCCAAGDVCGFTSTYLQGQCVPLPDDSNIEDNGYPVDEEYGASDPPGQEVDAENDFEEPDDLEELRGSTVAREGGCSVTNASRGGSWLAALLALGLFARRRRN